MSKDSIGVGLMGLGVVAGKVAKVLMDKSRNLEDKVGCPLILRKIKVLPEDLSRPQAKQMDSELFTTDDEEFFHEPGIDIVVEAIGGVSPALEYHKRAISGGKHVVTSNKELIAKHGFELLTLARRNKVGLQYEASVGGGIPIIAPFKHDLVANNIKGIFAIINGTTNYVLTRMAKEGMDFTTALKRAQELGYAIKLLAIAKQDDDAIEVRVHPVFIPEDSLLAEVDGVYNAILVEGDLVGKVLFYGEGAGAIPTSSSLLADIISASSAVFHSSQRPLGLKLRNDSVLKPMSEIMTRYYLRMTTTDRYGVLSQISKVLGDHRISISSVLQKETNIVAKTAEIVIMTHPAKEKAIQAALSEIRELDIVKQVNNFIRIEA